MTKAPIVRPVVSVSSLDCKGGNYKCKLGSMGCNSVQISGQPASNVEWSLEEERKCMTPVPTLGPGQYDLMVIGDMPGIEDDMFDMPWVDDSGQQVIDFLKMAGHDLDRVWMTKLSKCRPRVKGRKPSVTEYNVCRDEYLRKEIELIQPKVVLLVGAPSLKAFNLTGQGNFNAIHGKVFDVRFARQKDMKDADFDLMPEYKVIPTLNPASFRYRPNKQLQARVGNDYRIAKDILEGRKPTEHFIPEFTVIDTLDKLAWLREQCKDAALIGWDTESCGLGFRKAPVLCYQIAWGWNDVAVIPIMNHDPDAPETQEFHIKPGFGYLNEDAVTEFMQEIFLNPHAKCAHNHKYDLNVLRWGYGIEALGKLYDTWTGKHLQDEVPPSNLAFLLDVEYGWGDYEAAVKKITGSGKKLRNTYDKVPDDILWVYGATDALGTYRLCCTQVQQLQARPNLWAFHNIESEPLQRSLARAEYKGALVHTKAMDILFKEYEKEQAELLTRMRGKTSKPDFKPSSPQQVLDAFHAMGVPDVDLAEEKAVSGYSAAKNKLNDIVEKGHQPEAAFAADVMEYRNRTKMISTYLENCKHDMDTDGRVRYSWVIAGPVTGRLSCRFFHQIPKIDMDIVCYGKTDDGKNNAYVPFATRLKSKAKKKKIVMRDMFIAPEGSKYVYGDFSQVELRILAINSNDTEMLKIMADPKGDLHATTTYEFLKKVYPGYTEEMAKKDKFNRTEVGKRVNFGLAYGSEGYSLVKNGKWRDEHGHERNFTWDMLEEGMEAWKKRFSGVGAFIDLTPDIVRSFGGTATNVFGRERHFGGIISSPRDGERKAAERECVNFFIQSVAASITNRTIIAVDKMLKEFGIGDDLICLINTVHDSVAYEVKDHLVEWFQAALITISQQPFAELGGASFKIDCGVGENWTDAEMAA